MSEPRREGLCEICGCEYATWFAPSDLWNAVMRAGVRANPDDFSMACPTCFCKTAEARGRTPIAWVVSEETPYVLDLEAALVAADTAIGWIAENYPVALHNLPSKAYRQLREAASTLASRPSEGTA